MLILAAKPWSRSKKHGKQCLVEATVNHFSLLSPSNALLLLYRFAEAQAIQEEQAADEAERIARQEELEAKEAEDRAVREHSEMLEAKAAAAAAHEKASQAVKDAAREHREAEQAKEHAAQQSQIASVAQEIAAREMAAVEQAREKLEQQKSATEDAKHLCDSLQRKLEAQIARYVSLEAQMLVVAKANSTLKVGGLLNVVAINAFCSFLYCYSCDSLQRCVAVCLRPWNMVMWIRRTRSYRLR